MAIIVFNSEDIGDAYAPSINAAFSELFQASGVVPRVLSPYGGFRTIAQQRAISPGVTNPASSDHVKGRAVDINNHRTFRNWNTSRFLAILGKYGWRNVQISGAPFPTEPWHFANQSSNPQGSAGVPLAGSGSATPGFDYALLRRQREDGMYVKGSAAQVYVVFTDANGKERLRIANLVEGQLATAGGHLIVCSDAQLAQLGAECGWVGGAITPLPLPKVDAGDIGDVTVNLPDGLATKADVDAAAVRVIADVPPAVIVEQKKPGN